MKSTQRLIPILLLIFLMSFIFPSNSFASSESWNEFLEKKEVPTDKQWEISFNSPVNVKTVKTDTLYILDSKNNKQNIKYKFMNNNTKVIVLPPNDGYNENEEYTIFVTKDIRSANGQSLNKSVKMKFITQNYSIDALAAKQIARNVTTRFGYSLENLYNDTHTVPSVSIAKKHFAGLLSEQFPELLLDTYLINYYFDESMIWSPLTESHFIRLIPTIHSNEYFTVSGVMLPDELGTRGGMQLLIDFIKEGDSWVIYNWKEVPLYNLTLNLTRDEVMKTHWNYVNPRIVAEFFSEKANSMAYLFYTDTNDAFGISKKDGSFIYDFNHDLLPWNGVWNVRDPFLNGSLTIYNETKEGFYFDLAISNGSSGEITNVYAQKNGKTAQSYSDSSNCSITLLREKNQIKVDESPGCLFYHGVGIDFNNTFYR